MLRMPLRTLFQRSPNHNHPSSNSVTDGQTAGSFSDPALQDQCGGGILDPEGLLGWDLGWGVKRYGGTSYHVSWRPRAVHNSTLRDVSICSPQVVKVKRLECLAINETSISHLSSLNSGIILERLRARGCGLQQQNGVF